jgi:hypothetical protein
MMGFKQIDKCLWLSLYVESKAIGNSYCIQYLVRKDSKKRRVISHSDREYKKIWSEITKNLPDIEPFLRHEWVESRLSKMTKWTSPHHGPYRQMIEWGNTPMGLLGKKFDAYIEKKDATRMYKSRMLKQVKLIADKSGSKTTLTTQTLQDCVDHLNNDKDARSLSYIRAFITIARKFAKHSKLRGIDDIFNGVELPIKDRGKKKNRQHLERDDLVRLINRYVNERDEVARSSFFFQLWTGARPGESYEAMVYDSSIKRFVNKTKDKGVSEIVFQRTELFNAYMELTGIVFSKVSNRRSGKVSAVFQAHCESVGLIKKYKVVDRYWLRHSALTWLTKSIGPSLSLKDVEQMAGHANLRMLAGHYAKNMVTDMRRWDEAMPLNIEGVEHGYHGFIFEAVLLALYPHITSKVPTDERFISVMGKLGQKPVERKKIKLF